MAVFSIMKCTTFFQLHLKHEQNHMTQITFPKPQVMKIKIKNEKLIIIIIIIIIIITIIEL